MSGQKVWITVYRPSDKQPILITSVPAYIGMLIPRECLGTPVLQELQRRGFTIRVSADTDFFIYKLGGEIAEIVRLMRNEMEEPFLEHGFSFTNHELTTVIATPSIPEALGREWREKQVWK